jgi:tRNA-dihydrouridine synthase A
LYGRYEFLHDYIATVACSGVKHFIVHARKCLLNGLSPHENRTIPPLKYEYVYRLKNDFPDLFFTLNGGIQSVEQAKELLDTTNLDGIMVGRAAYTTPWHFRHADRIIFDSPNPNFSRREIIKNYLNYAEELQKKWGKEKKNKQYAMPTSTLMKPLLNLFK